MKFTHILLLTCLAVTLAGCRQQDAAIEESEPESTPVVFIDGNAEAFYIKNGPRFENVDSLIPYLKKNYNRIVLRETDKPVPFSEKLVRIFTQNGVAVEEYISLYPPAEKKQPEKKQPEESLKF